MKWNKPSLLTLRGSTLFTGFKILLGVSSLSAFTAAPVLSAERIYVSYGLLERSISIQSIETFAAEGTIAPDLQTYAAYGTPEDLEQLQTLLNSQAALDIDAVAVSQFLYTPQGEFILEKLGELIQTEARRPGFHAIRAALILAAADKQGGGLTPLNVLRHFPGYGIRLDVQRTLQVVQELEQLINETNMAIAAVDRQSAFEAATDIIPIAQLNDLTEPGRYSWQLVPITIKNREPAVNGDRSYETDLYLPLTAAGVPPSAPVPLVVISHGLGSNRTAYAYLAQHLASYGFAVAVPEHRGSNSERLEELITGLTGEVTPPDEFVNRPLDITALLDHLEYRSQVDPTLRRRFDLQRVGVVGQSLGGYTALALAGGQINLPQLQNDCPPPDPFNISLLLQCRALDSSETDISLRDERVKAIIAINPIGSSLLGEAGYNEITIPTMIVTGNADTIAPALIEQIEPFTWLGTTDKYLVLMRGGTHFSTLGEPDPNSTVVDLPPEIVGPDRDSARLYLNVMGVAFFQTYLAEQPDYSNYLRSAYARAISLETLPLQLVRALTPDELARSLQSSP